ncbi:MAG: hypothetical protein H6822_20265 [Planctomycetaceae bacterium]|nr:hypothetical protein [Planctomycetaceae bacterium]
MCSALAIALLLVSQHEPEVLQTPTPSAHDLPVIQPVSLLVQWLQQNSADANLQGIEVIEATLAHITDEMGRERPSVALRGILIAENQREQLRAAATRVLEPHKSKLGWPPEVPLDVDVSGMYIAHGRPLSDMARLLLIERYMDDVLTDQPDRLVKIVRLPQKTGTVRILHYDSHFRHVSLCGAVPSNRERQRITSAIERLQCVDEVDSSRVLLIDARVAVTEPDVHRNTQELYGEAIHALNDGISHRVIALCDQMIRMGRFSTSVWYLRAAASLQSGDEFLARGNARLAGAEQRRHTLFERLQGPMRIYLEKMIIQEGPFVSLPPTLSPDIAFHLQHADGSHESDDLNHMEREEIEAALAGGRFEEPVFRTGIRRRLIEKDASTVYEVAQRYDVPLFPENVIYVRRLRDGAGREMVGIAVPLNGEMRFLIH